jgi:hypothetical protein
MKILIADILKSDLAIFHNEGIEISNLIESMLDKQQAIEVSFKGLKRVSTQFLNAAIGRSYMTRDIGLLESLLILSDIELNLLHEKIEEVKDNARHSKEYDAMIENA